MVGADPKSTAHDRAVQAMPSGVSARVRAITLLAVLVPLSFVLVQCGQAPPPATTLAANVQATGGDSFEECLA